MPDENGSETSPETPPQPDPERDQLESALAAQQRENALLRALGGDALETPLGRMFADAYKGPLEVDKIRESAEEIGLGKASETTPPPAGDGTPGQGETQAALGNEGGFTPPPPPPDVNPRDASREAVVAARQRGLGDEDALVAGLGPLAEAALAGDSRVLVRDE